MGYWDGIPAQVANTNSNPMSADEYLAPVKGMLNTAPPAVKMQALQLANNLLQFQKQQALEREKLAAEMDYQNRYLALQSEKSASGGTLPQYEKVRLGKQQILSGLAEQMNARLGELTGQDAYSRYQYLQDVQAKSAAAGDVQGSGGNWDWAQDQINTFYANPENRVLRETVAQLLTDADMRNAVTQLYNDPVWAIHELLNGTGEDPEQWISENVPDFLPNYKKQVSDYRIQQQQQAGAFNLMQEFGLGSIIGGNGGD